MDRKFLEELGLEKEAIDKVLNQNGAELTAIKTQLKTKETEVNTLREDLVTANTKIAELEKIDVETLQNELAVEKEGRIKDRQNWNLKSTLSSAGCKDVDYLIYKLGDDVEFADDGSLKDKDGLLKKAKEEYAAQFATESSTVTASAGNFARNRSESGLTQEQFNKMGYQARLKLYQEDSATYNRLTEGRMNND